MRHRAASPPPRCGIIVNEIEAISGRKNVGGVIPRTRGRGKNPLDARAAFAKRNKFIIEHSPPPPLPSPRPRSIRVCRSRKLNLPGRQDTSLFSGGFRRLFAKLLLRNWDEGGVRATRRNEFTFFSRPPFSFPRKELEHILPGKAHFFRSGGYCETVRGKCGGELNLYGSLGN